MTISRRIMLWAVALALPGIGAIAAQAQTPDFRRLEIIVSTAAGGGTDTLVRQVVEELRPRLDRPIAIQNVPGDGSLLALSRVARANPNDAVIVFHNFPNTVLSQITRGASSAVDIGTDLAPLSGFARTYTALVTTPDSGITSFEELQAAYASGEQRLLGGFDRGGNSEIGAEMLRDDAELPFQEYIAYDGSGDALAAVSRNEVPATLTSSDRAYDGQRAGTLVPLLVLGPQERLAILPDTPTAAELGYRSMVEVGQATRVFHVSANMNPELRQFLVDMWEDFLTDPAVIEKLAQSQIEVEYISPEEVGALYTETYETLTNLPIVQQSIAGN